MMTERTELIQATERGGRVTKGTASRGKTATEHTVVAGGREEAAAVAEVATMTISGIPAPMHMKPTNWLGMQIKNTCSSVNPH